MSDARNYIAPGWDQVYAMLLDLALRIRKSGFKADLIVGVSRGGWAPARILSDLLENPPEETPGWHASELETSQVMAHNEALVHMERAVKTELTKTPPFLPKAFLKTDGAPDVKFEGYEYFVFPMEHREFSDTGLIGNPFRATKEKGLEAYRRFAGHLVRALKEFEKIKVEVKNREFVNRV